MFSNMTRTMQSNAERSRHPLRREAADSCWIDYYFIVLMFITCPFLVIYPPIAFLGLTLFGPIPFIIESIKATRETGQNGGGL